MQAPYSNSDQRLGKVPSLIFTQNETRDYSHDIDEDKDEARLRLSPLDKHSNATAVNSINVAADVKDQQ